MRALGLSKIANDTDQADLEKQKKNFKEPVKQIKTVHFIRQFWRESMIFDKHLVMLPQLGEEVVVRIWFEHNLIVFPKFCQLG